MRIATLTDVLKDETGQDIVEYALVMTLIVLGATVALHGLSASIAAGITAVDTALATHFT